MTDYVSAFKEGLAGAKAVAAAKKEIDEVLFQLNEDLRKETGGKIQISRAEREEIIHPAKSLFSTIDMWNTETINYQVLAASNPTISDTSFKDLARWSQDRLGYPCKITFGGVERSCEDREALERSLADLLRDPIVGERLSALMTPSE